MTPFRCKIGRTLRRYLNHCNHADSPAALSRNRIGRWVGFVLAGLMLFMAPATCSQAQDSQTQEPVVETLTDVQRLIRNSVQSRSLETSVEITQAAEMLVNVELFDDAKAMLGRLQALQLKDAQLLELTTQVGSAFFAEIYQHPELQPIGQAVGDYVLRGAQKGLQSPDRYDSLLRALNSDDFSARNKAVRELRSIGEPAMANVMNVFAKNDRVDDFSGVRGALKVLASELPAPIIAAALADNPQVRLEAVRALEKVDSKEALSALYLTILAPNQNDLIHSTALKILIDRPSVDIDSAAIEEWFHREADEALRSKSDPALIRQPSKSLDLGQRLAEGRFATFQRCHRSVPHGVLFCSRLVREQPAVAGKSSAVFADTTRTRQTRCRCTHLDQQHAANQRTWSIRRRNQPAIAACT